MKLSDVSAIVGSKLLDAFANHLAGAGYLDEDTGEVSLSEAEIAREYDAFYKSLAGRLREDARGQMEKGRR